MFRIVFSTAALCSLTACALFRTGTPTSDPIAMPRTSGEAQSGYTYVPIDPFPVQTVPGDSCIQEGTNLEPRNPYRELLPSLPDNAVRMLVEQFDAHGNVSYGVSKTGVKDESYRVTVDYINADTINQRVLIRKQMRVDKPGGQLEPVPMLLAAPQGYAKGSELYTVTPLDDFETREPEPGAEVFNIPVYVGLGLRVSANVYVVGANANISGIGVIGAEAEAQRLQGSLVVQTLGVNGESVAAALPIQSELNRTTAQNAIAAVGTLKALLYADETVTSPRVVGMYLPFPGGKPLVNALISALSTSRIRWHRPCGPDQATAMQTRR